MESKALETLGILRPNRYEKFVRFVKAILVVGVCVAATYICIRNFGSSVLDICGSAKQCSKDDGSLVIKRHLQVRQIKTVTGESRDIDGEMFPVKQTIWFKLSIDKSWYYGTLVPQVKSYIAKAAPNAKSVRVDLDTGDLAYSDDGAVNLRMSYSCDLESGDCWGKQRLVARQTLPNESKFMLLIDGEEKGGALTKGTIYFLNDAQRRKVKDWVQQNLEGDRGKISVSRDGTNIQEWDVNSKVKPIDQSRDYFVNGRHMFSYMTISPWVDMYSQCRRCYFLHIRLYDENGIRKIPSFKWTL